MKLVLPVPVPVPVPVSSGDLTSWWSNTNTGNTAQKGEMRCMNHSSSLLMLSNKRAYIMTWYNMTWLFFDGLNFGAIRSDWLAWTRAWTTVSSNIIFLFFLFFLYFYFWVFSDLENGGVWNWRKRNRSRVGGDKTVSVPENNCTSSLSHQNLNVLRCLKFGKDTFVGQILFGFLERIFWWDKIELVFAYIDCAKWNLNFLRMKSHESGYIKLWAQNNVVVQKLSH